MRVSSNRPGGLPVLREDVTWHRKPYQPPCPKTHMLPLCLPPPVFPPSGRHDALSNGATGSSSSACTRVGRHLGCCNALEQIRLMRLPWGGFLRNTGRRDLGNNEREINVISMWAPSLDSYEHDRHFKLYETIFIAPMWMQDYTPSQWRARRMWFPAGLTNCVALFWDLPYLSRLSHLIMIEGVVCSPDCSGLWWFWAVEIKLTQLHSWMWNILFTNIRLAITVGHYFCLLLGSPRLISFELFSAKEMLPLYIYNWTKNVLDYLFLFCQRWNNLFIRVNKILLCHLNLFWRWQLEYNSDSWVFIELLKGHYWFYRWRSARSSWGGVIISLV